MMDLHWLMRMSRWARHPPSWRMVKLVLAVLAISAVIVGLDAAGLWPDWASTERVPRMPLRP